MSNYTPTGNPVQITRATSALMRNEFSAIAAAIATKGDIAGQTWTGTHDYSGGLLRCATPVNGTDVVNKLYADNLTFVAVLPGQSLGFLRSTGTVASFGQTHTGYAQKESKGADIVCAATIDLTAATGNLVHINGSTGPVTAITVASGAEYTMVWDSTPTITHNATTLILPGAANITVAAGDSWKVRGDGSGNSRVVSIQRANGAAVGDFPYLYVREEQPNGVAGGSSLSNDITQTRVFNTVKVNTMGASLASNVITLLPGTYKVRISVPSVGNAGANTNKAFLYNSSDSTYALVGQNGSAASGGAGAGTSLIVGQFTISATKNFTVRHFTALAVATNGLGYAVFSGQAEVYSEAEFWKVA